MADQIIGLDEWWETPPGQHLLAWEQGQFADAVVDVFGFNALQLGVSRLDGLAANRMPHRWLAGIHAQEPADVARALRGNMPLLVTDPAALPFEDGSLDLILMPHTLELSADPHAVIREIERVLRPEGKVVISGLNPLSLWAMRQRRAHLCARLGGQVLGASRLYLPRSGEFIGQWRLRDWLRLLGFEVEPTRYGIYQPAMRTEKWLERYAWLDGMGARWWPMLGAVYMLVATKRVRGARLLGPAWKPHRGLEVVPASLARRWPQTEGAGNAGRIQK
jgi:SAM-dependent methyltransferase